MLFPRNDWNATISKIGQFLRVRLRSASIRISRRSAGTGIPDCPSEFLSDAVDGGWCGLIGIILSQAQTRKLSQKVNRTLSDEERLLRAQPH